MEYWQIRSQEIICRSWKGSRLRDPVKEHFKNWSEYEDFRENFVAAMNHYTALMVEEQRSFTLHIRQIVNGKPVPGHYRVAQIKWGFNNLPFIRIDYDTLSMVKEEELNNVNA